MAKTMTLRGLIAMLMLVLGTQLSFAQTFWTETFDADSWTAGGTNDGPENWTWTTDPLAGFMDPNVAPFGSATATTGYYYFNSDGNGEGNAHDVTLTGPTTPVDCSGKSNVRLRFHTQYAFFDQNDVSVGVSTDGVNFTYTQILGNVTPNAIVEGIATVALPEADNQPQVWIQFRYVGTWQYFWKVDDLELFEFNTPIHDVTFQVNTANITVDPTGMFIVTDMTSAPEAMTDEGAGIWSYTAPYPEGANFAYIFINGATGIESVPAACGTPDPGAGINIRTGTLGTEDLVIPAVCFSECAACVVDCESNPNKIVCDNMESYNTTQRLAQQNIAQNGATDSWWTTWSGTTGNTEDGIVTTEQANSGVNSFKILTTAPAGGPQDVVLRLGNRTTGRYELKWMYYVPAGKQAYYNIQNVVPIGAGAWNLDAFFGANNMGNIQIGAGASLAEFAYPSDEWFEVRHIIDLDNNLLTMWVNGEYVIKMAYPNNLGGIDFFGIDNNHTNYVDDVEFVSLPPLVYNVDICDAAVDLTLFFGQTTTQTTGIYDNTTATVSPSDPTVDCWGENIPGVDILNNTMWYTFVGDGNKYHIETVPCNATNYITGPGDTQMLIYSGDDCTDLTEVACNDDLFANGMPDWRAGLDLETEAGVNYYMLIDGFQFGATISVGEFCIEISQVPSITCADGQVGTYTVSSPYLCEGAQLSELINIDPASFILPNVGPTFGLAWAITSGPVDPNVLPTTADILIGSTGFLTAPFAVGYVNTGNPFPPGIYFITPIVVAGAVDGDPTTPAINLFDVDASNGCFFVGQSTQMLFLPLTDDITATAVAGNGSVDLTPGGGIGDIIGDPSSYNYTWSNGATTQDLSNVPAGTYTCTVTDDCSESATVTVQVTVATQDPTSIQSFLVSPNPTTGLVSMNLALATAAEVRIEVLNTLGQTLQNINAGKLSTLNQNIDLSNMAQGSYFLRVTIDGETAIRRVLVQR